MSIAAGGAGEERPPLRIVRGDPSPEELAAITAIVAAAGTTADTRPAERVRGRWNDPVHSIRRYWAPGPGGWRSAR